MVFYSQPNAHYELLNPDPNTPTAATKPNTPFVAFRTTKRTLGAVQKPNAPLLLRQPNAPLLGCGGEEDVVVRVVVVEVVDCGDGAAKVMRWSYGGDVGGDGHGGDSGMVGMTKQDGSDVVGIRLKSGRKVGGGVGKFDERENGG
ncbi:hypothetical protein Tco_0511373 [Tanacetum coccineum]